MANSNEPGAERALVLFAHGSRDPEWAAPFRAIQRTVSQLKPHLAVELAFLELMQPTLPEAVGRLAAAGCRHCTVAPLFMAQGAHLKRDLAEIVRAVKERHPELDITVLPAVGEVEPVVHAMATWLGANV